MVVIVELPSGRSRDCACGINMAEDSFNTAIEDSVAEQCDAIVSTSLEVRSHHDPDALHLPRNRRRRRVDRGAERRADSSGSTHASAQDPVERRDAARRRLRHLADLRCRRQAGGSRAAGRGAADPVRGRRLGDRHLADVRLGRGRGRRPAGRRRARATRPSSPPRSGRRATTAASPRCASRCGCSRPIAST